MTDWHCHILPGIDDGPVTDAEALAMARVLATAGFRQVCCTPHAIRGVYDNHPAGVKKSTRHFQQRLTEEGIGLSLLPGMEYWLDEFLPTALNDLLLLPGNLLLVEIPQCSNPQFVVETLYQLLRNKITPLIAHPERCDLLASPSSPETGIVGRVGKILKTPFTLLQEQAPGSTLLGDLRTMGCSFQGNLGSFAGIYGNKVKNKALGFLQSGLYDCFGSDAHQSDQLGVMLKQGIQYCHQEG